jgi:hypothetical protein
MKLILKDIRAQKAERDHLNADRARNANLALLRAEGNALWNDFQAEEQNKAKYKELEAYDRKTPTRTMIDPTEELAQEQRINDAISRQDRAGIKTHENLI